MKIKKIKKNFHKFNLLICKLNPLHIKYKGFTVIELVIASAIMVIISTAVLNTVIGILRITSKNSLQRQVTQEARFLMETVTREARLAWGSVSQGRDPWTIEDDGKTLTLVSEFPGNNENQWKVVERKFKFEQPAEQNNYVSYTINETSYERSRFKNEIIIDIDFSGSMNDVDSSGQIKLTAAKDAANNFLGQLDPEYDQAALVTYKSIAPCYLNRRCTLVVNTDQQLTTNFDLISSKLTTMSATGGTPMASGLSKGVSELDSGRVRNGALKIMIFLSDGCPTVRMNGYATPSRARTEVITQTNVAKGKGIKVFTIGLGNPLNTPTGCDSVGNGLDENLLKYVAQETGGTYYRSPTGDQLQVIFDQIAQIITTQTGTSTTTTSSTSFDLNVKDLMFEKGGEAGQPYLTVSLSLEGSRFSTKNPYNTEELKLETTVSSAAYSLIWDRLGVGQ